MSSASSPPNARRSRLLLIAVLAGTVLATAGWFWSGGVESRRQAALASAENDPPEQALALLLPALGESPQDRELLKAVVTTMQQANMPAAEIEPYSARWAALPPDQIDALEAHWTVLHELNRPPGELLPVLERMVALEPGNVQMRTALVVASAKFGRFDSVLTHARAALAIQPDPKLQLLAAQAMVNLGDDAGAAVELDKYLKDQPDVPEAILLQATVQHRLGNDARVVELCRDVKVPDPLRRIPFLNLLGQSYARLNLEADARRTFEELKRLDDAVLAKMIAADHPADVALQLRSADTILAADVPAEAVPLLEKSLEKVGRNREVMLKLAECYDKLGEVEKARMIRASAN